MIHVLLLLALYAGCLVGLAAAARSVARPLPKAILVTSALLPLLFFSPGLLAGKTPLPLGQFRAPPWGSSPYAGHDNPYLDDVITQFVPWMQAVREAWREGELPFRNRWNGCGMPLAANGSSSAFSPLTFLAWPLPLASAFLFIAAVKLLMALVGTWLWLRELRLAPGAALFGAIAFGFSFSMVPWIFFPHSAVLALWPWALFAIELLSDRELGARPWILLTAVFTLWPLSGHIESAAMGAGFTGLWVLARLLARDFPDPRRLIRRMGIAAAAALGLSAFYLLPHAHAIGASNRLAVMEHRPWESAIRWSPHGPGWPLGYLQPLFPRTLGDGLNSPMLPGAAGSFPEMALGFFGVTAAAAVLLFFRPGSPRPRTEWTLWIPLIAGLGTATFAWPFIEAVALVPGLGLVFPLRFFSWVALAGAALAAFEVDRLQRDLPARRWAWTAPAGAAALLALAAVLAFLRFRTDHAAAGGLKSQTAALALTLAALTVFALAPALLRSARRRSVPVVLALLCAAELFSQGRRLYRFSPADPLPPPDSGLLSHLRSQSGVFRVIGDGYVAYPNTNVLARLEEIRTHDPLERREYVEWLDRGAGYPLAPYFKYLEDANAPALNRVNVRYFVGRPNREAPGPKWKEIYDGREGTLFENTQAMPRVFVSAASPGRGQGTAEVGSYRESTNAVSFQVRGSTQGVLLETSLVDDGGWSATSSRGPVRIARKDGPFVSLVLPPGDQAVRLRYLPPGFREGAAVSAATVLFLAAAASWSRRRRRAAASP